MYVADNMLSVDVERDHFLVLNLNDWSSCKTLTLKVLDIVTEMGHEATANEGYAIVLDASNKEKYIKLNCSEVSVQNKIIEGFYLNISNWIHDIDFSKLQENQEMIAEIVSALGRCQITGHYIKDISDWFDERNFPGQSVVPNISPALSQEGKFVIQNNSPACCF